MKDQDPTDKSTTQSSAPESKKKPLQLSEAVENMIYCPVSSSIFLAPVTLLCGDGHVLEEEAALKLLQSDPKCPCCRRQFTGYIPNHQIKNLVTAILADDPKRKADQHKLGEFCPPASPLETKPPVASPLPSGSSEPIAPAMSTIPATTTTVASTITTTTTAPSIIPSSQPILPIHLQASFAATLAAAYEDKKVEEVTIDLPTFIIITPEVAKQSYNRFNGNMVPLIKVLLVGDAETRRSVFLLNLADDSYTPSFITTIGIDFKIKELNGEKFQIWDTAGQERFRTITTAYYKGASVIMLFGTQITDWIRNIKQLMPGKNLRGFIPRYGSSEVFLEPINLNEATNPEIALEASRALARSFGNQLLINCSALVPKSLAETKIRATITITTTTTSMPAPPSTPPPLLPTPPRMITLSPPTAFRASHHNPDEKKPGAIQLPSLVILTNCRKTMSSATRGSSLLK